MTLRDPFVGMDSDPQWDLHLLNEHPHSFLSLMTVLTQKGIFHGRKLPHLVR